MAKLYFPVWCEAWYDAVITVPDGMTREEAFGYAKEHLDETSMGALHYLPDSDNLDDCDMEVEGRVRLVEEVKGELRIPEAFADACGLVIAVRKGGGLFVAEISLGDGSQWLPEDDEACPECDEYLTGSYVRYAGGSETADLFKESDGIWFAFSSEKYPDWHDAILPCLDDIFGGGEDGDPVYTVIAAAE